MSRAPEPRRGRRHPPLGRRTPARTEDFFDADQLAALAAYARPRKRVAMAARVVTLAVEAVLLFGLDLGPRIVDALDAPWPVQLVAVVGAFAVVGAAIEAPFGYWSTLVHDRRHGMSNHGLGLWASDLVKDAVLGIVLSGVVLVPIFAVVREVDSWWLAGGLLFLGLAVVLNFVYPVWIMPRFNRFTPMEPGPLRARIEEIAAMAGTSIEGVYTMDGSRRSRRGNAFVAGFGPTKRVVVFDTMLALPLEQVATVVAHEIGHYRLHHIPKSFPLAGGQMLASLAFVQWAGTEERILSWAGVDALGDPGSAPLFIALFGVPSVAFGLVSAWLSRRHEREADLEALELLRDPDTFVAMWPAMVELNKADLEPGWWERRNASHPEIPERMQFGLDWAELQGIATRPLELASVAPPPASAEGRPAGAEGGPTGSEAARAEDGDRP